jgi:hypothetical protein
MLAIIFAAILYLGISLAEETVVTLIDGSQDRGITVQGRNTDGSFRDNPTISGQSPTTGLAFSGKYMPVLVNIDNMSSARPQWGIAQADIIYELPIQSSNNELYTRLTALFSDQYPASVGPLRSARIMHVDLREEWDAIFVFWGMQSLEGTSVKVQLSNYGVYKKKLAFNGIDGGKDYTEMFEKTTIHPAPHNKSLLLPELIELLSWANYPFIQRPFLFTDTLPTGGISAYKVTIDHDGQENSNSLSFYTYDESKKAYLRAVSEGAYVDYSQPDTQLSYSNVIIQRAKLSFYAGNGQRPLLGLIGEGLCDIFMGGRYIAGYWARNSLSERTVYFDSDGNELHLLRGKTWITVCGPKTKVSFEGYTSK